MSGLQSLWEVAEGEALSLTIGPGARELSVAQGRLWLTLQGSLDQPGHDIWLEPGQSVRLPSGSKAVIEAWPSAQFQLLVPPSACASAMRKLGEALRPSLRKTLASALAAA
ncbi:DUF2917 domain-containing protein [Roseateles violae]|uniref:DUF2917 domain-containing protein n=1 Tax=Roseateles violae TaxID=3058042 RepID=A0ABT8DXB4_9BURK|nr:DUF2917 domain-containing protein [Pelomonas sp. PFR6]MDN3921362.1 DUF2917 domain-containing protein [Pelomonas sp. PFR6]